MRLNSQSGSGKWWSSLQGRGEVEWGEFNTWGESPSSAGLRPHEPWRTGQNLPPVLLETLALYSYMTFENAKVAKIGKGIFFFQIELTAKEFLVQK